MTRVLPAVVVCLLVLGLGILGSLVSKEAGPTSAPAGEPVDQDPARSALSKQGYPWYDAANDRVKPVSPPRREESTRFRSFGDRIGGIFRSIGDFFARIARYLPFPAIGSFGNALPILLIVVGVVLLAILLRVLWMSASFAPDEASPSGQSVGRTGRIALLPGEMAAHSAVDPWAEADERRRRGDYSGAIIYLFAHQLLELDRLGLIRLTPGRTGRRYVLDLKDDRLREPLSATLGLFEQAYYGHKRVHASSFEAAWAGAQALRSHLASIEGKSR